MAMRTCSKCLENNWKFEHIDGMIKATCNICGNEVEFEAKKKISVRETGKCRKCNHQLIFKIVKKPKTFKNYLFCPKCKAMYMGDRI